jgi:hypothetical protein
MSPLSDLMAPKWYSEFGILGRTLIKLRILHEPPRLPPNMRSSFHIAAFLVLAFGLASIAPSLGAAPVHLHPRVRSKAHSNARPARKTSSKSPAREPVSARGGAKSTRRSHLEARKDAAPTAGSHRTTRAAARRRGRYRLPQPELQAVRLNIPAPLRGSHESLVHQNEMAEADGLERILDDADLEDRIAHGSLVPVPVSPLLHINTDLPENRRYCRPWTAKFLADLSHAHSARFAGSALEVTSAVRTVEYQRRLRMTNGNAASADGDIASPHLTGGTIDIAKAGMTAREIGWMRAWLIPLEQQGKIDVEEEFRQSCFHISVYKSYSEAAKPASHAPLTATPMDSASMLPTNGR